MPDLTADELAAIRRRIPDIPRSEMSRHEEDRADLLAEVERLQAVNASLQGQIDRFMADIERRLQRLATPPEEDVDA